MCLAPEPLGLGRARPLLHTAPPGGLCPVLALQVRLRGGGASAAWVLLTDEEAGPLAWAASLPPSHWGWLALQGLRPPKHPSPAPAHGPPIQETRVSSWRLRHPEQERPPVL